MAALASCVFTDVGIVDYVAAGFVVGISAWALVFRPGRRHRFRREIFPSREVGLFAGAFRDPGAESSTVWCVGSLTSHRPPPVFLVQGTVSARRFMTSHRKTRHCR